MSWLVDVVLVVVEVELVEVDVFDFKSILKRFLKQDKPNTTKAKQLNKNNV